MEVEFSLCQTVSPSQQEPLIVHHSSDEQSRSCHTQSQTVDVVTSMDDLHEELTTLSLHDDPVKNVKKLLNLSDLDICLKKSIRVIPAMGVRPCIADGLYIYKVVDSTYISHRPKQIPGTIYLYINEEGYLRYIKTANSSESWSRRADEKLQVTELSNSLLHCLCNESNEIVIADVLCINRVAVWFYPFTDRLSMLRDVCEKLGFCGMSRVMPASYIKLDNLVSKKKFRMYPLKTSGEFMFLAPIIMTPLHDFTEKPSDQLHARNDTSMQRYLSMAKHVFYGVSYNEIMETISNLKRENLIIEQHHPNKTGISLYVYNFSKKGAKESPAGSFRGVILDHVNKKVVSLPLETLENISNESSPRSTMRPPGDGDLLCIESLTWSDGPMEASLKMDGTSVIIVRYMGDVLVSTKNTFESKRVELVEAFLESRDITQHIEEGYTYICEYVGGANERVIPYVYNGLYLITVTDHNTGMELDYESRVNISKSLGIPVVQTYLVENKEDIANVMNFHENLEQIVEGVVLRSVSGKRFKYKLPRWINLAKSLYTTPLDLWVERLRGSYPTGITDSQLSTEILKIMNDAAVMILDKFLKCESNDSIYKTVKIVQTTNTQQLMSIIRKGLSIHSPNHKQICSEISICLVCSCVWHLVKPINNDFCMQSIDPQVAKRIQTILQDDWPHFRPCRQQFVVNEDIFIHILEHLDVQSLLKAKMVGKSWYNYINQCLEFKIVTQTCEKLLQKHNDKILRAHTNLQYSSRYLRRDSIDDDGDDDYNDYNDYDDYHYY